MIDARPRGGRLAPRRREFYGGAGMIAGSHPVRGELAAAELHALLCLAARTVRAAVLGKEFPREPRLLAGPPRGGGAFVTLRRAGELAGCIGYVAAAPPLEATVVQAARSAALEDPRFLPVEASELDQLQVEISVLSEAVPIEPQHVQVGLHGLILEFRGRRGLLLPQVATEHNLDREGFLAAICHKTMAPRDAWRDPGARLSAFTAQVHGGALPQLIHIASECDGGDGGDPA